MAPPYLYRARSDGGSDEKAVLKAAFDGNLGRLKGYVKSLGDPGVVFSFDTNGVGVLHIAAMAGHLEVCKYLVEELGGDVNAAAGVEVHGSTPFMVSSQSGDVPTVKYLLDHGGDLMKADDKGRTVLHHAVSAGYVKSLGDPGVIFSFDMNGVGVLHIAAMAGHLEVCKYLVEELGGDVNAAAGVEVHGSTPFMVSAQSGDVPTVKYLLEHGGDLMKADDKGRRVLHHAVSAGSCKVTEFLLSKGVPVDIDCGRGTSLFHAATNEQDKTVKILLEHHANPNTVVSGVGTALLSALIYRSLKSMKLLIKAGADINGKGSFAPPLVFATSHGGYTNFVQFLLKAGADPNIPDDLGRFPVELAALRDCMEEVEMLFPLTSPIPNVQNWSIDGIIRHAENEEAKPLDQRHIERRINMFNSQADTAFKNKEYKMASKLYDLAIDHVPSATLYANRSLCQLLLGDGEGALSDALRCGMLRPNWAKVCYHQAAAHMLLKEYKRACDGLLDSQNLDPTNVETESELRKDMELLKKPLARGFSNKQSSTEHVVVHIPTDKDPKIYDLFCKRDLPRRRNSECFTKSRAYILRKCCNDLPCNQVVKKTFEKVAKLLTYINDKHLFHGFHRKKISRRLLFDKNSSVVNLSLENVNSLEIFQKYFQSRNKLKTRRSIFSSGSTTIIARFNIKPISMIVQNLKAAMFVLSNAVVSQIHSEDMFKFKFSDKDLLHLLESCAEYKVLNEEPISSPKLTDKMPQIKVLLSATDMRKNAGDMIPGIILKFRTMKGFICDRVDVRHQEGALLFEILEDKHGLPMRHFMLIFSGKIINPWTKLSVCGFIEGSEISVEPKCCGGAPERNLHQGLSLRIFTSYLREQQIRTVDNLSRNELVKQFKIHGSLKAEFTDKGYSIFGGLVSYMFHYHALGKSWNGKFSTDIFFVHDGRVLLRPGAEPTDMLCPQSVRNDFKSLASILFREAVIKGVHAVFILNLCNYLKSVKTEHVLDLNFAAFIRSHPALLTPPMRSFIFWQLRRFEESQCYLTRGNFRNAVDKVKLENANWLTLVQKNALFKNTYHTGYNSTPLSCYRFFRDWLTHGARHFTAIRLLKIDFNQMDLLIQWAVGDFLADVLFQMVCHNFDVANLLGGLVPKFLSSH